jgi:hypothetical protein
LPKADVDEIVDDVLVANVRILSAYCCATVCERRLTGRGTVLGTHRRCRVLLVRLRSSGDDGRWTR